MENLESSAPKSKSVAGWIFGVLSCILPLIGMQFGLALFVPLGVVLGAIAITFGVVKKNKGQIFLGIAGALFAVFLLSFFMIGLQSETFLPTTAQSPVLQ